MHVINVRFFLKMGQKKRTLITCTGVWRRFEKTYIFSRCLQRLKASFFFDRIYIRFWSFHTPFFVFLPFRIFGTRSSSGWVLTHTCENFQAGILYNFQFDHMVLKHLPTILKYILDFFLIRCFFFVLIITFFLKL